MLYNNTFHIHILTKIRKNAHFAIILDIMNNNFTELVLQKSSTRFQLSVSRIVLGYRETFKLKNKIALNLLIHIFVLRIINK